MPRRLFAEFVATAGLLVVVIGSGIMAERLAGGNVAIALLANALATVGGLYVLIELFGPVSGAHMNPAVSVALALRGRHAWPDVAPYAIAQLLGAVAGACMANAMFELPLVQWSTTPRTGAGLWLGEVVATAGLVLIVLRAPPARTAAMVAAYIGAAYWFTSSTAFANPAVAFGRMFSATFTGIAPVDVPAFVVAQFVGVGVAIALGEAIVLRRLASAQDGNCSGR